MLIAPRAAIELSILKAFEHIEREGKREMQNTEGELPKCLVPELISGQV